MPQTTVLNPIKVSETDDYNTSSATIGLHNTKEIGLDRQESCAVLGIKSDSFSVSIFVNNKDVPAFREALATILDKMTDWD